MRSVKNIAQVTKALEAVSGSKVRRAQQAVLATRPYASKAYQVLQHLGLQPGNAGLLHPLLQQRETIRKATIVLITSDRGLCGAYNTNIIRTATTFAQAQGVEINYIAIGRKSRDFLVRRKMPVAGQFVNLPGNPTFADVSAIGRLAVDEYLSGRTDSVYLAYTDYVNALRQDPRIKPLLPLRPDEPREEVGGGAFAPAPKGPAAAYFYEPSQTALLDSIVPRFTQLQVFQAILESLASEHSARMAAMRSATDAARDLLDSLQLGYNKARQLSITSDILDIVGGVEALAQA